MSVSDDESQPSTVKRRGFRGSVVVALWAVVTVWIVVDPLTGSHSQATGRCLRDITFALVAVACAGLTTWMVQQFVAAPRHTVDRAFELGYLAGCADTPEGPPGRIST